MERLKVSPGRRWLTLAALGAAAGVLVAAGWPAAAAPAPTTSVVGPVVTAVAGGRRTDVADRGTRSSFAALQRRLDGPAGVVVFPVGAAAGAPPLLQLGGLRTGVAWSTSKVPVTVAALSRSSSATTRGRARAAITRSDNAAAERLWSSLGSPARAGRRTQAVLRAAGDIRTVVQHRRVRPGFTAFGQTEWTLLDQARFAAGLTCVPAARSTVRLMRQVVTDQHFGLGRLDRTAFKGGWGPVGRHDAYLVRQLGIVTTADGRQFGVAIGVRSASGFSRGRQDLNRVAGWLEPRLRHLDGGRCPRT